MIVLTMPQRTQAWYAARAGRLCASEAKEAFATKKTAGEPASVRDLRLRLAIEQITGEPFEPNGYVNAAMQRGIDLEPAALRAYEAYSGELVTRVGFCQHDTLMAGASTDGLVGDEGVVEVKCPGAWNHLRWMREREMPAEHELQLLHALWITGRAWCDFASYCPGLPAPIPALWVTRYRPGPGVVESYEVGVRRFLDTVEREKAALLGFSILNDEVTT